MSPEQGPVVDLSRFSEIQSTPKVVDVLCGEISELVRTKSFKPDELGEMVDVRLVLNGPGMYGLTDWEDSRKWAGIFNHSILSARYSLHFARQLAERGHDIDLQTILDGMIVSHSGRRQWEEADHYREKAPDSIAKRKISNERLGLRLIKGKVPPKTFNLVAALAHENTEFPVSQRVYDSLEYRICEYVDHRTTDRYMPLVDRMSGFFLANFYKKDEITPVLKEEIRSFTNAIIEATKSFVSGESDVELSLERADKMAKEIGIKPKSKRIKRKDLIELIIRDAETEAFLIREEIYPNGLNDNIVSMPEWERKLRFDYVGFSRESLRAAIDRGRYIIDQNSTNWWDQFAVKIAHN